MTVVMMMLLLVVLLTTIEGEIVKPKTIVWKPGWCRGIVSNPGLGSRNRTFPPRSPTLMGITIGGWRKLKNTKVWTEMKTGDSIL